MDKNQPGSPIARLVTRNAISTLFYAGAKTHRLLSVTFDKVRDVKAMIFTTTKISSVHTLGIAVTRVVAL